VVLLGIALWGGFCVLVLLSAFKCFRLPKRKLIPPILLVLLTYVIPVLFFWENTLAVNSVYGVFFLIMLVSLVLSWTLSDNQKTVFYFFLGVILIFSVFWALNALPYRPNWEPMSPSYAERVLGVRAPFHHSSLFPIVAGVIVLLHCCFSDSWIFRQCFGIGSSDFCHNFSDSRNLRVSDSLVVENPSTRF
jgi:CDP-diglyceride synthetase